MQHCWGGVAPALRLVDLHDKLKKVASNLGKWNRDTFGSVRKEIKKLTAELERLRSEPGRTGPSHLEIKLNDKLVELYHREELMWRQRSRIEWLASGDKNTRFFHLRATMRRKKSMIKALANSLGVHVQDPAELREMVTAFHRDLYTTEVVTDMDRVLQHVPRKVTPQMNEMLTAPYTKDEVKKALFQMGPTKSPGPDGFPAHIYQRH